MRMRSDAHVHATATIDIAYMLKGIDWFNAIEPTNTGADSSRQPRNELRAKRASRSSIGSERDTAHKNKQKQCQRQAAKCSETDSGVVNRGKLVAEHHHWLGGGRGVFLGVVHSNGNGIRSSTDRGSRGRFG